MDEAAALAQKIEACFRHIRETRMADVPILNPALDVEMVGLQRWPDHWFGILVTPWFINMLLLPDSAKGDAWGGVADGAAFTLALPAARFGFIAGREDDLGRIAMCSLFSPVLEFATHADAVSVACHALAEVMSRPAEAKLSRRGLFGGIPAAEPA